MNLQIPHLNSIKSGNFKCICVFLNKAVASFKLMKYIILQNMIM